MEKRLAKINISTAGGTAGKGAKTYKLTIPSTWVTALGITGENRDVELTLNGDRIVVAKPVNIQQLVRKSRIQDHKLMTFRYYDVHGICSRIFADFTEENVCVENDTDNPVKTAFGRNTMPTWDDFMAFLEERCIPRQRAGIREYLETLGLDEYDPLEIVKRTHGRMAEDDQWLEVIDE